LKNENAGDTQRVVEIDVDVKSWEQSVPGVRDVRPPRCPCCTAPGVTADGRVVLHGHGLRVRQHWGPAEPEASPGMRMLVQRRYACQECGAVVVVRPRGTLPRKRYTATAIVLAMWLWAAELMTDAAVRSKIAIEPTTGLSRPERWTTLRRWAAAARDGELWDCVVGDASWTLRQCAGRAALIVAGFADVTLEHPHARVFAGAAHAR
jgi:hypothetical protein